ITALKGKYISETHDYITELGLASSAATLLPRHTLLITTRATVGKVAIAGRQISTNQGFKNIVLDGSNSPLYYYYFLSGIADDEMRRLAVGSTFDEISRKEFIKIIVPQPNSAEQCRIANIIGTLDEQIQLTE